MSEKMANKYVGLVDYQELESNIRPLSKLI